MGRESSHALSSLPSWPRTHPPTIPYNKQPSAPCEPDSQSVTDTGLPAPQQGTAPRAGSRRPLVAIESTFSERQILASYLSWVLTESQPMTGKSPVGIFIA